jgi:YD repeat-containing protein
VADPINPANGGVSRQQSDISSAAFKRFYDSQDKGAGTLGSGWRHSYSRSIKTTNSSSSYAAYTAGPMNSSLYNLQSSACTDGFSEIRSQVNEWTSATASYSNGTCTLKAGSTIIGTLPILYTSAVTPAVSSVIGLEAVRDDGKAVRFMVSGSSVVPLPGVKLKLLQTSAGYTLTDIDDSIETYNANGKLMSIVGRNGIGLNMGYDTAGRLSGVTDTFGHALTLTYDSQGRLSAVTRQ